MHSKERVHNPRLLFVYVCLLIGILGMEAGGLQYNLLQISEELDLNTTQMGNIVSVEYFSFIIFPLLFGGIGDRYGKKVILVSFGLCFAFGCLAIIFSQNFLMVLAAIFLIGAGYSMCESTGTSVLTDMYRESASRYINWSQSCFSIGALISPPLCQYVRDHFGLNWRTFFCVLTVLYVVLAVWAYILKFPPAPQLSEKRVQIEKGRQKRMNGTVFAGIVLLALACVIYAGMETGVGFFMGTHVSRVLGTEKYNSLSLSMFWLMMIPSRYLVGLLKKYPRKMLLLAYLGASAALGVVIMATTKSMLVVIYAIAGFFFAPIWPLVMGEAGNLDPENTGHITGVMVAACGVGGVVAPTVFGLLADHVSLTASLLFIFGITAAGFVISVIYNILMKKLVITSK